MQNGIIRRKVISTQLKVTLSSKMQKHGFQNAFLAKIQTISRIFKPWIL